MMEHELSPIRELYAQATTINCRVFASNGSLALPVLSGSECGFCDLIHHVSGECKACQGSYVYGGLEAEKLGDVYIYFCPYGLVNWAVPVLQKSKLQYIVVGGPVLMHAVDDVLINSILQHSVQLQANSKQVVATLNEVPIVDPTRVRHLADLLFRLVEGVSGKNTALNDSRRDLQRMNAHMAQVIHELKGATESMPQCPENLSLFEYEKELISRVRIGDVQGAREVLNQILGHLFFYDSDFQLIKARAIEVLALIARTSVEAGADLEVIFGLKYLYFTELNQIDNTHELSELLIKVLARFMDSIFSIKNLKNRDLIFKAMSYIRKHYNQEIGLEQVAAEIGMNPTYFSKLFKEETQTSYSDYINRVRIEESKQLLQQGKPLVEISQLVGFNDQSYFSKVFKKYEGVSPGQWRP